MQSHSWCARMLLAVHRYTFARLAASVCGLMYAAALHVHLYSYVQRALSPCLVMSPCTNLTVLVLLPAAVGAVARHPAALSSAARWSPVSISIPSARSKL